MKIYVGNLPFALTAKELEEIFAEFGAINSARIVVDKGSGRSKGFGFVDMVSKDAGWKAITGLNGKEYLGRNIRVGEAKKKKPAAKR